METVDTVLIGPLAWEPPYVVGEALQRQKDKRKKKKRERENLHLFITCCRQGFALSFSWNFSFNPQNDCMR